MTTQRPVSPPGAGRGAAPLRDLRLFWGGDLFSQLGSQTTLFLLPVLAVAALDASGTQVGLLQTLYMAPFVVLPLLAGLVLEHRPLRPVLVLVDVARAALVAAVAVTALSGRMELHHLWVAALVGGCLTVVYDIAVASYVPRLASTELLDVAHSRVSANLAVGGTAGPGVGGWAASLLGPAAAMGLGGAAYLGSALTLVFVRRREVVPVREHERDLRRELSDGVRAVFANPPVRAVSIHAAIYNAGIPLITVGGLMYLVGDLGMSSGGYGTLLLTGGAGAITGALSVPRLIARIGYGPSMLTVLVFSTLPYLLLPAFGGTDAPGLAAAGTALFVGSGGAAAGSVVAATIRQRLTPQHLRTRMNATYRLVSFGAIPLGSLGAGVLTDLIGARETLWLAPLVLLVSCLPVLLGPVRGLREIPG
ncbi:MFS transporter [Nocardiopsis sp. FIRDI 009]|uniref:MFS transporter n=1 Tax=Nocardiopsis sp. FIRDI 009 TaxID=714197 RepID=UPI000E250A1D|nr:MFS transporter [Nocardiopsis sp. FIRDI 009]